MRISILLSIMLTLSACSTHKPTATVATVNNQGDMAPFLLSSDAANKNYRNIETGEIAIIARGNHGNIIRPPKSSLFATVDIDPKTGRAKGAKEKKVDVDGDGVNDFEIPLLPEIKERALFHSQVFVQLGNGQWQPQAWVEFDNISEYQGAKTLVPFIVLVSNVGNAEYKGSMTFVWRFDPRIQVNSSPLVLTAEDNRKFLRKMREMTAVPFLGFFTAMSTLGVSDYEWGDTALPNTYSLSEEENLIQIEVTDIQIKPGEGIVFKFDTTVHW